MTRNGNEEHEEGETCEKNAPKQGREGRKRQKGR